MLRELSSNTDLVTYTPAAQSWDGRAVSSCATRSDFPQVLHGYEEKSEHMLTWHMCFCGLERIPAWAEAMHSTGLCNRGGWVSADSWDKHHGSTGSFEVSCELTQPAGSLQFLSGFPRGAGDFRNKQAQPKSICKRRKGRVSSVG